MGQIEGMHHDQDLDVASGVLAAGIPARTRYLAYEHNNKIRVVCRSNSLLYLRYLHLLAS